MGIGSNRVVGARRIMQQRARAARDKAATLDPDSQFAASLRGKAMAYDEAADLLDRLDKNRRLDRAHRWGIRKPQPDAAPDPVGETNESATKERG